MARRFAYVLAFLATSLFAQEWHPFFDAAAFGTSVTETGPRKENRVFSTNWLQGGVQRDLGGRGMFLARARVSLEPLTIPKEGYPQLMQYVSQSSGGPLVDRMRAHDLLEEAVVAVEWRPIALRLAPVGEPPIGAQPYAQRPSSIDFAEAPFAYDVQESFHRATRVVTGGITTRALDLEYGVFHQSPSTGRHTSIDDGNIDSWGARVTLAPESPISAQFSTGRLGDAKTKISSASISWNGGVASTSAIWTKRGDQAAYSFETSLRGARSVLMGRAEWVDRPLGIFTPNEKRTTHLALGYIFDVLRSPQQRAGIGINADYHNASRALEQTYGHKPQSVYLFVRWRTDRATRPASP